MSTVANQVANPVLDRRVESAKQAAIVVGASLFVALCARVSVPIPGTPVPLTLSNFAVLAVGLLLGSRRGFAALALYLAEGAAGLPVFSMGGGMAHLFGLTGGYLLAYPLVAFVAGYIYERSSRRFVWAALASVVAEVVLFASGLGWLAMYTHSFSLAIRFGFTWFVFGEIIKVLMAAGAATSWNRRLSAHE
ncbi:MAG TPA: biotin transporter BioY [Terriglobales bacterium]|nr:biotin transporter BioY [Terriglobales bacterium]